jgi:hypothetical protein
MKLKDEILYGKFNRSNFYHNPKHISSQFKLTQKPITENSKPIVIAPIKDKEGLTAAYGRTSKLYVNGDTMYIAGTSSLQDVADDIFTVPFNRVQHALRYKDAKMLLDKSPDIKNLSSHSLGSSVALLLQKNHPDKALNVTTYGAPIVSFEKTR